jgi:hypothetical protein
MFVNGACGISNRLRLGLQRLAAGWISVAEPSRCGTTADAGTGKSLCYWFQSGDFVRGVATRGSQIVVTVWWFDSVLWGWRSFACYLYGNFGNEDDARSLVEGVARPSCTREEESNGGCGEAPTRCGCSDSVFFTPSDGFALLQQYCGKGSCMAVALLVWWCLFLLLLYRHLITLEVC